MTANLKIGPCPKCGNTTFITTAHVTQTWLDGPGSRKALAQQQV